MKFPAFMRENPSLALFAVLAVTASGFGQTFFLSVFGTGIRDAFDLANSSYGFLYGLATVFSAAMLLKLGPLMDRWAVGRVTLLAIILLTSGCLLIGLSPHWGMLIVGFMLVRLGGQAMLPHVGMTVASRYFVRSRGRIMALTAAGFPLAEAILPLSAGLLLVWGGWRLPWFVAVGVLLGVFLPLLLYLARGATHPLTLKAGDEASQSTGFTRSQALRDPGFYCVLPAALVVPFTVTAVLFHQTAIADLRDWPTERIAAAFTGFAAGHLLCLLFAGRLVDGLGAQRALVLGLMPIFSGLLVLAFTNSIWTPYLYLALTGASLGLMGPAAGAIWPERYGVSHVGAIRSVAQAAMVFSTALSPILVGYLLDIDVGTTGLAVILAALVALGALLGATTRLVDARQR